MHCVVNYIVHIMNLQKKANIICRKKLKLFFKVNKFETHTISQLLIKYSKDCFNDGRWTLGSGVVAL